jgi:glycosyltransferase involved in cell wall biosynthesis
MRILVASSNHGVNGAAMYARRLVPLLQSAGHHVILACEPGSWIEGVVADEAPLLRTDFSRWPLTECDRVAAFCRAEGVDVVHSHLTRSGNFAALVRARHGVASVAHLHANHPQFNTGMHDVLIAVSEDTAARHRLVPWNWSVPIETVQNFVDPCQFRPAKVGRDPLREALGVTPGTPVIAVVGAISRRKGQDLAVRAFAEVRHVRPDAVLAVIGIGELPAGLPMDGVRLLGQREDVPGLLPHATVAVVPSRDEPFGLAAVEAMACGVPVVAFAVGGLREVLRGGAGVLVAPEDVGAMSSAVGRLLESPLLRRAQGDAGLAAALERFGPAAHLAALERVYRRLA